MARASISRGQALLKADRLGTVPRVYTSSSKSSISIRSAEEGRGRLGRATKACLGILAGTAAATCAAVLYALDRSVVEAAHVSVHPIDYPWSFRGIIDSLDHSAIRRGWLVYKTVCSTCHSIQYVAFRDFVNVFMTDQEARDTAAEYEVEDGPDENGEYFSRPGKLQDLVPSPYPNEEAARAANNGAYPVDLTYIVYARKHGVGYVFGLLTGYTEAPAGIELFPGQAFNPYFEGGAIGMPEMLQDGLVEYEDGTSAYKSQMAKDVVEFLVWTANQDWETRKQVCFKGIVMSIILFAAIYPAFRQKMASVKNTKIYFIPKAKTP